VKTIFGANCYRTPHYVAVGHYKPNGTQRIQHGGHILGTGGGLHIVQKRGRKLREHLGRR
jgi:hypothetical protein